MCKGFFEIAGFFKPARGLHMQIVEPLRRGLLELPLQEIAEQRVLEQPVRRFRQEQVANLCLDQPLRRARQPERIHA